jgi:hypothetical protein
MLPEFMAEFEKQVPRLKPSTRIVAHDYAFPHLKAERQTEFKGPDRGHTLYLWIVKGQKQEVKGKLPTPP